MRTRPKARKSVFLVFEEILEIAAGKRRSGRWTAQVIEQKAERDGKLKTLNGRVRRYRTAKRRLSGIYAPCAVGAEVCANIPLQAQRIPLQHLGDQRLLGRSRITDLGNSDEGEKEENGEEEAHGSGLWTFSK